jgi:hypothetical protein
LWISSESWITSKLAIASKPQAPPTNPAASDNPLPPTQRPSLSKEQIEEVVKKALANTKQPSPPPALSRDTVLTKELDVIASDLSQKGKTSLLDTALQLKRAIVRNMASGNYTKNITDDPTQNVTFSSGEGICSP